MQMKMPLAISAYVRATNERDNDIGLARVELLPPFEKRGARGICRGLISGDNNQRERKQVLGHFNL